MNSFLRKYSAMANMDINFMKTLFTFRPATIGNKLNVYGADFEFFYSLHTIPCIGFVASYHGKSIYFSGDTLYNPDL
jgi:ribonuclease BN (tRNA processing enzyme)